MILEAGFVLAFCILIGYIQFVDNDLLCFNEKTSLAGKSIELHYFHSRGRAEAARLMLELSGVAYKDVRYTRDEWLAVKKTNFAPFNQLPVLVVDGKRKIAQSHAIVRFIARASGLAGRNDTEVTDADQLAGFAEDMRKQYSTLVYNSSASTLLPAFLKDTLPSFFSLLEQRLVANGGFYGGGSFFVGDGLTYADVMLYDIVDTYRRLALDKQAIREAYPSLMGFVEKFESNLRIKAYINSSRRAPNPNGKAAFVDNEGAK